MKDRCRLEFILVAAAAFLAGLLLGQAGAVHPHGHSRIEWPAPHPRSLEP